MRSGDIEPGRQPDEEIFPPFPDFPGGESDRNENDASDEEFVVTEEMNAQVQAALAAVFAEPFPEKPYALMPEGGEKNADYVIHKDIASEHQCILIFDSIVDAFTVAEEYKQGTGREAEAIECDIYTLEEDRFWVKFYRANGAIVMMSLPDYKSNIGYIPEE